MMTGYTPPNEKFNLTSFELGLSDTRRFNRGVGRDYKTKLKRSACHIFKLQGGWFMMICRKDRMHVKYFEQSQSSQP